MSLWVCFIVGDDFGCISRLRSLEIMIHLKKKKKKSEFLLVICLVKRQGKNDKK